MDKPNNIICRPIKREELKIVHKWMMEEKWPTLEHSLMCAYDTDSTGHLVTENQDGEITGYIGCNSYKQEAGIGWIIVKPECRKSGYGITLFDKAMSMIEGKNMFLCTVETSAGFYFSRGFKFIDSKMIFYSGKIEKDKLKSYGSNQYRIESLTPEKVQNVCDYDKNVYLSSRSSYLEKWIDPTYVITQVAVGMDGLVIGYGCMHTKSDDCFTIGPLYADNTASAMDILVKLLENVPEEGNVALRIVSGNDFMADLVKELKLKELFKSTRMYSKKKIDIDFSKVYCATNGDVSLI